MSRSLPTQKRLIGRLGLLGLAAAVLLASSSTASAQVSYYWSVNSGNWSSDSNWGGTETTSGVDAYIINGGTATIDSLDENCSSLRLGGTNSGTVQMIAGRLSAFNQSIGDQGVGTFSQSGGTNSFITSFYDSTLYLGYGTTGDGTYNLSGTGLLRYSQREYVGYSGTGTFNQSGGTNSTGPLYLGYNATGIGNYYLSGSGSLSASSCHVGYSGTGTFTQSGSANSCEWFSLGEQSTGNGTYVLSGGSLSTVRSEDIGRFGTGTFIHSGGTHSANMGIVLGWYTGSKGSYELSGSALLNSEGVSIGSMGTGTFSISGGTNSGQSMSVGVSGSGIVSQSAGVNTLSSGLTLGYYNSGNGSYDLSGGLLSVAYSEHVGYEGSGTFTQSGGTNSLQTLFIAYDHTNLAPTGSYNLSGSGILSASSEIVGYADGTATFTQSGGTNTVNRLDIGQYGKYTFTGGSLSLNGGLINKGILDFAGSTNVLDVASSFLDLSGGTLSNSSSASLNLDSHSLLIASPGFVPEEHFASYHNDGLIHYSGSTLTIPASSSISGTGDIIGYVDCQGVLRATSSSFPINLTGGLKVSPGAIMALGAGSINLRDENTTMTAGSLSAGRLCLGYTNTQSFTHSGGTCSLSELMINYYPNYSTGAYILSGSGLLNTGNEEIGSGNDGKFIQSGGTNSVSFNGLYLASSASSNAVYDLSGGLLKTIYCPEYIGYSGSGTFTQTGGTNSGDIQIGCTASGHGAYFLSGSGRISGTVSVGASGTGTFLQSGGTCGTSWLYIGKNTSGIGFYRLSGGSMSFSHDFIGYSGSGTLTQTGGTNTMNFTEGLVLGNKSTGIGCYNLSDSGYLKGGTEIIGWEGKGTFTHTGGTNSMSFSGALHLGYNPTGVGRYDLSGTGYLQGLDENVGYAGSGTFTQTGGTNSIFVSNGLYLGRISSGNGTYNLNGGLLSLKSLQKGYGSATFNFGGGTLQTSGSMTCSLPMNLTGVNGNANLNTNGYAVTLSGTLSGDGGLNKLGGGTLTLGAANTYHGDTNIQAGTLALDATGSIDASTTINIGSGAFLNASAKSSGMTLKNLQTLKGLGTVVGDVLAEEGSRIAPGNSVGTLTFNGNLTLNDGALLDYELGDIALSDKIVMNGSTLTLDHQDFTDFTFAPKTGFGLGTYTLIDAGTISGSLGSAPSGILGSYRGTLSISGNDLVLTVVVPEPGTLVLLLSAGLGLCAFVRRKRTPIRQA